MTGPDGQVVYETIDVAAVEGTGADAKVVTQSEPFSGYVHSQNTYSLTGLDPTGAIGGQVVNQAILLWAFDEALPGQPLGGTITGKIVRVTWNPGATVPAYEPVPPRRESRRHLAPICTALYGPNAAIPSRAVQGRTNSHWGRTRPYTVLICYHCLIYLPDAPRREGP